MSRCKPGDAGDRGFTLLEVLVVLAIAGLVLALAVPLFGRGPGRPELAAASREIAATLRLARWHAIAENRPASFFADAEANAYGAGDGARRRTLPASIRLSLVTTSEQAAEGAGTIRFYPDGSSSGGAVVLWRGGSRFEVLVDWLNGGVSIHERADTAGR